MREIKFRAWDKKNKIMIPDIQNLYDGFRDDSGFKWKDKNDRLCNEYDTSIAVSSFGCNLKNNKIIIMQFTGLKDKKGVEIYEGDIVEFYVGEQHQSNDLEKMLGLIEWSAPSWVLSYSYFQKVLNINVVGEVLWCDKSHNNIPDIYGKIEKIEVIGNIYENPELLEVINDRS